MKLIVSTALALATLAGAASAATGDQANTIRQYAPNADVSALSPAEVASLLSYIHGGNTEGEIRKFVNARLQ